MLQVVGWAHQAPVGCQEQASKQIVWTLPYCSPGAVAWFANYWQVELVETTEKPLIQSAEFSITTFTQDTKITFRLTTDPFPVYGPLS